MSEQEKTVTKAELAKRISGLGLSLRYSQQVVDYMFSEMIEALQQGEIIHLVGFGSFRYKTRKARQGRNPKTGEQVSVPDKKVIHFRPGSELKTRVRQSENTQPDTGAE